MSQAEFEAELRRDGFGEVTTGALKPNESRGEHAHDYEVRALVLYGEISLTCDGRQFDYKTGDVFTMLAGKRHSERAGPAGIRYVVGRRH